MKQKKLAEKAMELIRETAKKLTEIQQLEQNKVRLEAVLRAHGIDATDRDVSRGKETER